MQSKSATTIVRISSWFAWILVVVTVIGLPLGYYSVALGFLSGGLETEAEINASAISQLISKNPDMWTYEQLRLKDLLSRGLVDHPETRRIVDTKNRVVAESSNVLKSPLIMRSADLLDSGVIVARIEIYRSLRPLLIQTGIVAFVGLFAGLLVWSILYFLPLSTIREARVALDKAYRSIEASLKEKEVLMDEIYHRVKNNMQTIISLLRLQSRYIEDKKSIELLAESQNRIRAMALVHEKLYQTKNFTHINYADYIKDLVDTLREAYGLDASKIAWNLDIEDKPFGIEPATHLGLIINELVNNALKYAFPGERTGEIRIMLKKREVPGEEAECELTVADNGIGIPDDLDLKESKTLGLRLVTLLAEDQLHGHIEVDRAKGTEIRIKFKESVIWKRER